MSSTGLVSSITSSETPLHVRGEGKCSKSIAKKYLLMSLGLWEDVEVVWKFEQETSLCQKPMSQNMTHG